MPVPLKADPAVRVGVGVCEELSKISIRIALLAEWGTVFDLCANV